MNSLSKIFHSLKVEKQNSLIANPFPLYSDLLKIIWNYLPIKAQLNLSQTCKMGKDITKHTLALRAKEYGCPITENERRFLYKLYKVVEKIISFAKINDLNFLFLNETKTSIVSEQVLLNFSKSSSSEIAKLYSYKSFYKIKDIQYFHHFLTKQNLSPNNLTKETESREALILALKKSDYFALRVLLMRNITTSFHFDEKYTPVTWAINEKQNALLELLLEHANINYADQYGAAPLHWAARKGCSDLIKFLLSKGADIESIDALGNTPLFHAIKWHEITAVLILLQNKAKIDIRNKFNDTPLIYAIRHEFKDIIHILLKNNADPNFLDGNGKSPLSWAITFDVYYILRSKKANDPTLDNFFTRSEKILHVLINSIQSVRNK